MINSIQHFQQEGIKKLAKIFEEYSRDLSKMAEMVYGITEEVTKLGCSMIAEEWESYDEILRGRKDLRNTAFEWSCKGKDRKYHRYDCLQRLVHSSVYADRSKGRK